MFQIGNVVKLKSGGPDMTVRKIRKNKIECVWFREGRITTAIFHIDTLELTKNEATAEIKNSEKE